MVTEHFRKPEAVEKQAASNRKTWENKSRLVLIEKIVRWREAGYCPHSRRHLLVELSPKQRGLFEETVAQLLAVADKDERHYYRSLLDIWGSDPGRPSEVAKPVPLSTKPVPSGTDEGAREASIKGAGAKGFQDLVAHYLASL